MDQSAPRDGDCCKSLDVVAVAAVEAAAVEAVTVGDIAVGS